MMHATVTVTVLVIFFDGCETEMPSACKHRSRTVTIVAINIPIKSPAKTTQRSAMSLTTSSVNWTSSLPSICSEE
jgi:hypothetical protein